MRVLEGRACGLHLGRTLGGRRNVTRLDELQILVVDKTGVVAVVLLDLVTDLKTDLRHEMRVAPLGTFENEVADPKILDLPTTCVLDRVDCRRAKTHSRSLPSRGGDTMPLVRHLLSTITLFQYFC